ncbi:MAG: exodeoxyribonuclease VII large subunit [Dehalococcoidia bacterium]
MIEAYTVSRLARLLKELLESDLRLANIWVEGEISNLTRSSAGHTYFTLKDEAAQLRCVLFRRLYSGAPLEAGAQVLAHGYVSLYEARGELQFYVDFVEAAGVGVWQAQFERLKAQLEGEGLFDPARKRPLPPFPRRIGVATSPAGAVFHDICQVVGRRWPLSEVVLAPTNVQGPEAASGTVEAIQRLNQEPGVDVIIVARGGGSIEELSAFNDEEVARAIYGSPLPVIAGVGHETDYTIADYVADLRAPTPSAAAELAVPDRAETARQVAGLAAAAAGYTGGLVAGRRAEVVALGGRLRGALLDVSQWRERVANLARTADVLLDRATGQRQERVGGFVLRLRALDPRNTLARGYAIVQRRDEKRVVTSAAQVKGRDRLDIYVKDGHFPAEVSRQYGF